MFSILSLLWSISLNEQFLHLPPPLPSPGVYCAIIGYKHVNKHVVGMSCVCM